MLEAVMDYIHNYFVKDIYRGTFTISGGELINVNLQDGQYFKIVGSVFNDAVYKYPALNLIDETFTGQVWAMAVPPTFIALCTEIEEWQEKYGELTMSPYSSESFGGYSYTKASWNGSNGQVTPGTTWQSVFGNRLNHWRKIA